MAGRRVLVSGVALIAGVSLGAFLMLRGPSMPRMAEKAPPPQPVTFYTWSDANGVRHVSNEAPPPGVAYETSVSDGVLTTLDPPKPPAQEVQPALGNPLSVYSPGGMAGLVKDAGKAVDAVNQAHEERRNLIDQQK